jgi:Domain of unknown function (DUF5667)
MKTELELAEILERCLAQVRAGVPVADVLQQHPDEAERLRPLVALGVCLELLPDPRYSTEAAMQKLAEAAKDQKRAAVSKPAPSWSSFWPLTWLTQIGHRNRPASTPGLGFRPVLLLYRVAAVAMVLVVLFWGAGTISASAVPGDFLYPLKLLTERVKFYLTLNAEDKAELRIVFSSQRLREAVLQYQRSGTLDPRLLQQMLDEARQAVETSLALPEPSRQLLVAQAEHLSQFQGQALQQIQSQLPAEQRAVVTRYAETWPPRRVDAADVR